jgi:hypothetical protein
MDEKEKVKILLEKIKDGTILGELTEYDDLEKLNLNDAKRRVIDTTVRFNERGLFPKSEHLIKDFSPNHIYSCYGRLSSLKLMFNVTIPDLTSIFGYYVGRSKDLPENLNRATWGDIKEYRNIHGSSFSWNEKEQTSRSKSFKRYYIALISKNGLPVFRNAFSFLGYLKTKPESK